METMFWVWLAIIVITVVIEIVTLDLVSVWFAVGAVIPFILAGIGGIRIEIQIAIFVIVSALLIAFIRKYAQKLLFKNMKDKTNMDIYIDKEFKLLEGCDFENNGSIKINDVVWTAKSENGQKIEKNTIVKVVKLDGNKVIVKPVIDSNKNKEDSLNKTQDNNLNNNQISEITQEDKSDDTDKT